MKTLRTIAAIAALPLTLFGLTACTDDCDASGTSTVTVAAAAHFTDGKGPGGKSGKSKTGKSKVHGSNNCQDDH